ncbi:MAG: NAD-dependent epimerase/dehydratase family protein [Propionicimonas sp.]
MDTTIDLTGIPVDTGAPVLVTGATGYVAGWIVKALLDAGVTVHAAVRDPASTARVGHLRRIADNAPGELRLFAADLLQEGSYDLAMQDCRVVLHTASPFIQRVEDPQRDLVDPALRGTRNVLASADRVGSVRRVVLTSSVAAIYTDASEVAGLPGQVLTEEVWNTTASLDYEPYNYSKTLAEREAWELAGDQDRWRLVVINPALVVGPALNPGPTSESFAIVKKMGDGTMRFGAPRLGIGAVDVRDVARAHLAAAYLPDAEGRHIVSAHDTDIFVMAQALIPRFSATHPIPTSAVPRPLVWLAAPSLGLTRTYVARNVDHVWRADATKSRRALGMRYRPLQESMEDMFGQVIAQGGSAGHRA